MAKLVANTISDYYCYSNIIVLHKVVSGEKDKDR